MLVLEQDFKVATKENTGCNLILLWTAVSNKVLIEAHEITGATRITIKHSGKEDGILEILKSPWSHRKCFLTTAGRDQQVLMAAASLTEVSEKLNPPIQIAKCVESKEATSPFLSKIGATLDMLLALRGKKEIPREMGHILKRDTVSVSIRFSHELNALAVESIEKLGLKFTRLPNGDIARSGTIYGAEIPWDKVYDLSKLEKVVRIESAWQPKVEAPVSQSEGK